jgi:hypothetical protein
MEEFNISRINYFRLTRAGLIAISLIILQDWISVGIHDPASLVSLIAFAVSLPILVLDLLLTHILPARRFHKEIFFKSLNSVKSIIGIIFACIGITAAIWHASWIVGVIFLFISLFCFIVYASIWVDTDNSLKEEEKKLTEQTISE